MKELVLIREHPLLHIIPAGHKIDPDSIEQGG